MMFPFFLSFPLYYLQLSLSPRRSSRQTSHPPRLGFEETPIPSVENSAPDPRNTSSPSPAEAMGEPALSAAQQATMERVIQEAVNTAVAAALAAARQSRTPSPPNNARALTADLMPPTGYFLPVINQEIAIVETSKVRWPKSIFSDHKGDIRYADWKLDMKFFIEEYSGNFRSGNSQVKAYFKCTGGVAKTLISQRMDPEYAGTFENASDVLNALDQRFFDHTLVPTAKLAYNKLHMGSMSYTQFRDKFVTYAMDGKISPARWFDDVCEKISPSLKQDIRIEKYKMGSSYTVLDEFLAIADRESRNIAAEVAYLTKTTVNTNSQKKDLWQSPKPPANTFYPASSNTLPLSRQLTAPSSNECYTCGKTSHYSSSCPDKKSDKLEKKISEMVLGQELETDELSENS